MREGFFAQSCFISQQAAEKALKALHYLEGERLVVGHSVTQLLDDVVSRHRALQPLRDIARQLDQYYIPTRYPNGLPGGVPSDVFTRRQADAAVVGARSIVAIVHDAIGKA